MQAVFTKVISFILSVLAPLTGLFTDGTPVASNNIAVIDGGWSLSESVHGTEAKVITTYEEFNACFAGIKTDEDSEEYAFLSSVDESYFENGNLAVVTVTLADTGEYVVVESAAEKGSTLKISYTVEDLGMGATVICYDAICVKTSKNITKIESTEKGGFTMLYRSFMGKLIEFVR